MAWVIDRCTALELYDDLADGVITAKAAGTATITITGKDTTYSMSSPAASTGITLTEKGGQSTTIEFTSGK